MTNATIAVADLAQFPAYGSFTLGGKRVGFTGKSASSGAGNLTGCYSGLTTAGLAESGTVAAGTALGNSPTGFFAAVIYKRFGYDGRPIVGSTQAFGAIASYKAPTLDDSAECGSFVVVMADSGAAQTQHNTVTGGEMTAQTGGNWLLPDGYTGALTGGGVRTQVSATDHVKNAIGLKINPTVLAGGVVDNYDGIYQTASAYQGFGLVNGAVTAGSNKTIAFDGATTRPPTPTAGFPGSVVIGANPNGAGGQVVTYTGITGTGADGTLTGATVGSAIADNATISNRPYAANLKDLVASTAGFAVGDTGYSGAISMLGRGGVDTLHSMLALAGPTSADSVAGGLCQLRINAGSDQTNSMAQFFDTGGTNRLTITKDAALISRQQIQMQTSSGSQSTCVISNLGYLQLGTTAGLGSHLYSGSGAPNITGSVAGDIYFRTDTPSTANQRVYVATGANTWTGIL